MNDNEQVAEQPKGLTEDWTAVVVGLGVLFCALITSFIARPKDVDWAAAETKAAEIRQQESELSVEEEAKLAPDQRKALSKKRSEAMLKKVGIAWEPAIKSWLAKLSSWGELSPVKKVESAQSDSSLATKLSSLGNPLDSFRKRNKEGKPEGRPLWELPLITCLLLAVVGASAVFLRGYSIRGYLLAFPALFALAVLSYLLAEQAVIKYYNLEYAMWALLVGMLVCNTVGVPKWLEPAVQGEIYIKIGLILLGAEVLFSQLLALGIPGVFVSWLVTPTVLIGTYIFGQKVLKMESRSLNMVISADMSVCGVSAAIATSAACKAKKEELSLAIGLSLAFTAIMMVVMPRVILWMELDPVVGGAWIGGTIDSTGAVAAAGTALGIRGSETAITVKMIQNILIGIVAMGVAIYWTRWVEPAEQQSKAQSDSPSSKSSPLLKAGLGEIWRRFPKFVLGFIAASLIFSAIFGHSFFGASWVQATTKDFTVLIRGWLFCLAFVSIGLTTNFRQLAPYLIAGKPMVLYVCGQALNLLLTFLMAYLMFGILFKS
jgi:uncharacterized integral membrane protein (TIGR00698 family)